MVRQRSVWLLLLAALTAIAVTGEAQTKDGKSKTPLTVTPRVQPKQQGRTTSLTVMGGAGWPLAKESLTDFWKFGPIFAATFSTSVNRHVSVGVGVDLTVLRFSYDAFWSKYPDVIPLDRKVIWWDVYLLGKYTLLPQKGITPYATFSLGATRLTQASFKQVVDSVKITYYEIPPRNRLSIGIAAGADFEITREVSFVAEIYSVFVHNDPEAGMLLALRGGFRFTW